MLTIFSGGFIMYVVITGTSRGIGLKLTQLALEKGHHVLAIARKPNESTELMSLKEHNKTLEILTLDLNDQEADKILQKKVSEWPQVDVLINNAGVYRDDDTVQDFEASFLTNSIKPLFVTRALFDKLKKSKRPLSLQITSHMGSISDNNSGGSYSYRASKAALNMIYKCVSIDEKWLISLLVHPGWVQTRMGGEGAPLTTSTSTNDIWKLIEDATPSQSGSFLSHDGEELSW
jgi:NAD(P)-dependent dehydrogenase (short-subunit alcohol dehydrogenase family)